MSLSRNKLTLMNLIKLTDQDGYTRRGEFNETRWEPGWIYTAVGPDDKQLCGPGLIHAYEDLLVGLFLNPIHASLVNPRAFLVRGNVVARDCGLKVGCRSVECVKELVVPAITNINRIAFGILAVKRVYRQDSIWNKWADLWLSGVDRSAEAVRVAAEAARETAEIAARVAAEGLTAAREVAAAQSAWDAARAAALENLRLAVGTVAWSERLVTTVSQLPLPKLASQAHKVK